MAQQPDPEVVDEAALLSAMANDWDTVCAIVRTYNRALVAYRQDLQNAVANGDPKVVHEIAHKLKGSLANLRAPRARVLAEQLEREAKAGVATNFSALSRVLLEEMDAVQVFFRAERFLRQPDDPER